MRIKTLGVRICGMGNRGIRICRVKIWGIGIRGVKVGRLRILRSIVEFWRFDVFVNYSIMGVSYEYPSQYSNWQL
jgi:hypothetical protein